MSEQQKQNLELSPMVQQALSKLNVRMMDFMEQINVVINVLVNENTELRGKLGSMQEQQQKLNEMIVKK